MIRRLFALGLCLAAAAAWSQSTSAPSFGPDAPWAQAYARCTNDAAERLVAAAGEPKPWPEQVVAQAQRECVGQVPDSSLGVRATMALVRSEVLHRFGPGRSLALAPRPPLALPTMFPMGNGGECPHPDYPSAALRAQAEGVSAVEIIFDEQGRLVDGRLVGASGTTREHRLLDGTALEAFALCRFPATTTPGNRSIRMSYNWRIVE
jgi:TonB family protein